MFCLMKEIGDQAHTGTAHNTFLGKRSDFVFELLRVTRCTLFSLSSRVCVGLDHCPAVEHRKLIYIEGGCSSMTFIVPGWSIYVEL